LKGSHEKNEKHAAASALLVRAFLRGRLLTRQVGAESCLGSGVRRNERDQGM
jgi:hypothetical protein